MIWYSFSLLFHVVSDLTKAPEDLIRIDIEWPQEFLSFPPPPTVRKPHSFVLSVEIGDHSQRYFL